jgi:hypothetical protein
VASHRARSVEAIGTQIPLSGEYLTISMQLSRPQRPKEWYSYRRALL